jgi:hypothetical protein
MARLRRNKERPPQTIHVQITLEDHEFLDSYRIEKDEAFYSILHRALVRHQELEFYLENNRETMKQLRIEREIDRKRIAFLETLIPHERLELIEAKV